MLKGMKAKMQRGEESHSDFSMKYLNTAMENAKLGGSGPKDTLPEEITTSEAIEAPSELVSFEALLEESEPKKEATPMLDGIEEYLEKIASNVVEQTMRRANKEINALKAQINSIATQKQVMHVKLGTQEIKKLTNEAHELLPALLVACNLRHNPLLVGPMGCGKTTFAAQIAEALGLRFGHLGLTAGASETWLFGRQTPTGFKEAQFSDFYRNGGVFLLDEIDAADSNLLISMNCALANGSMYNPILGEEIKRHKDFVCIAAANTFGLGANAVYTGRNRLDGATLDRFPIFEVDYNKKLEEKLCPRKALFEKFQTARKKLSDRNATQVISTRQFQRVCEYIDAGMEEKLAINTFTASWPKGLAEEIGLISKKGGSNELAF